MRTIGADPEGPSPPRVAYEGTPSIERSTTPPVNGGWTLGDWGGATLAGAVRQRWGRALHAVGLGSARRGEFRSLRVWDAVLYRLTKDLIWGELEGAEAWQDGRGRLTMPTLAIRQDLPATELRRLARHELDRRAAMRLWAIAHALDG